MPINDCLKKMGFSDDEARLILEDVGDGDARAVVEQHIKALEEERASIEQQAQVGDKLQPPEVANPALQIPDSDGNMVNAAEAMAAAKAQVEQAQELAKGIPAAIECALRFGS